MAAMQGRLSHEKDDVGGEVQSGHAGVHDASICKTSKRQSASRGQPAAIRGFMRLLFLPPHMATHGDMVGGSMVEIPVPVRRDILSISQDDRMHPDCTSHTHVLAGTASAHLATIK
jgi:hypothetical protein